MVYFVGSFFPRHRLMAEYAEYRAEFNAGRIMGRCLDINDFYCINLKIKKFEKKNTTLTTEN